MKSTVSRVAVLFAAVAATVLGTVPAATAAPAPDQTAVQAAQGVSVAPGKVRALPPKVTGWDVPTARSYYLTASWALGGTAP